MSHPSDKSESLISHVCTTLMTHTTDTGADMATPDSPDKSAKVKGPASYFPSIEKKYGQPISHWKDQIRSCGFSKHMEIVNWLKEEHGLGHGHANALVAYTLAADT